MTKAAHLFYKYSTGVINILARDEALSKLFWWLFSNCQLCNISTILSTILHNPTNKQIGAAAMMPRIESYKTHD